MRGPFPVLGTCFLALAAAFACTPDAPEVVVYSSVDQVT